MRVGLQVWGSDGDIRPMVAVAAGLSAAGHEVRLVATSVDDTDYRGLCRALQIPLQMVPERVGADLASIARRAGGHVGSPRALRLLLEEAFDPHLAVMVDAARALVATSDVVVGHFAAWFVRPLAEAAERPFAALVPWPGLIPTQASPPGMLPPWSILRRPGWTLFRALVHLGFRGRVNAFLRRERLAPVRSVLDDVVLSPRLNLVPTSPCLFPPPPDWAGRTLVTGCVSVPEAGEPAPFSVALQAFLASGLPPVFLSLGSSEQIDPARAGSLLVEAARTCGRRAIVQLKSRRVVEDRQEGDVLFVGRVRHASLFPRCAVVVHHGGAGTTQTVALAGVPSVVVPFVDEQRWWGRRLQRAGAACAPLCYASATAPRLAAAIRDALDNAALADGSQRLGRALRSEDGVTVTVRALERLVEGSRRG